MPTGYTAGIIDGTVNSFEHFAKLCMRAFGATIHMKDDRLDAEYKPDEPTGYHTKSIEKANADLKQVESLSDSEIVALRRAELEDSRAYHVKSINETKLQRAKLDTMLSKAEAYVPPTSEHTGIKDFMIKQLTETIRVDGDTSYHDKALSEIEKELANINVAKVRESMKSNAMSSLEYHKNEHAKDLERISSRDKWVKDFIASLPKSEFKTGI